MNEQFLEDAIKSSPFGYAKHKVVVDENDHINDYVFLAVNDAFIDLTGLKREDVMNKAVTSVMPTIRNGAFDWVAFYGELSKRGGKETFEQYSEPLDRWYLVHAVSKGDGIFTTVFFDITAYKEKNKETESELNHITSMASNLPAIVYRCEYKEAGFPMIFISEDVEKISGYKVDDFTKGKAMQFKEIIHPKDCDMVSQRIKQAISRNKPWRLEYRVKNKNGTIHWIEERGQAILDQQNNIKYLDGFFMDITTKKTQELKLSEDKVKTETLYGAIFDTSMDAIVIIDSNCYILNANHVFFTMTGHDFEHINGLTIHDLETRDACDTLSNHIDTILMHRHARFESQLNTKDLRTIDVEVSAVHIETNNEILLSIRDITEEKQTQVEMKRLKSALDYLKAYVYMKDDNHRYTYANKRTLQLFNTTNDQLMGFKDNDFFTEETTKRLHEIDQEVLNGKETTNEIENIDQDGRKRFYIENKAPIYDPDNLRKVIGILGVSTDITKRKTLEEKIRTLSMVDPLTNIYNRRYIFDRLEAELKKHQRTNVLFSIAIIDLDDFKLINDDYGHLSGDQVLYQFSQLMKSHIRPYDIFGRFGGEEFIMVLYDIGKTDAVKKLNALLSLTRDYKFRHDNHEMQITFSAGIADITELTSDTISVSAMIAKADRRLYEAKENGKNQISIE